MNRPAQEDGRGFEARSGGGTEGRASGFGESLACVPRVRSELIGVVSSQAASGPCTSKFVCFS